MLGGTPPSSEPPHGWEALGESVRVEDVPAPPAGVGRRARGHSENRGSQLSEPPCDQQAGLFTVLDLAMRWALGFRTPGKWRLEKSLDVAQPIPLQ